MRRGGERRTEGEERRQATTTRAVSRLKPEGKEGEKTGALVLGGFELDPTRYNSADPSDPAPVWARRIFRWYRFNRSGPFILIWPPCHVCFNQFSRITANCSSSRLDKRQSPNQTLSSSSFFFFLSFFNHRPPLSFLFLQPKLLSLFIPRREAHEGSTSRALGRWMPIAVFQWEVATGGLSLTPSFVTTISKPCGYLSFFLCLLCNLENVSCHFKFLVLLD